MKLLDNFTKTLVALSIVGIALGIYSLFFYKRSDNDRNPADKIASIVRPNNDTRLKRSGNIHWFPVSQDVDAFDQDVIFTGKDSVATIKFKNGAEVTLLPMSLITISNGNVHLNSGTIEVNLDKGSSLKVESFGEQFEIKDKTSFKVQNTQEVKRIVPIAKTKEAEEQMAKTFAQIPSVRNYIQNQTITITGPGAGERIPKFNGSSLTVKWKASVTNPNNAFKVQFSPTESFDRISYTTETPFTNIKVPTDVLSPGMTYVRVQEAKGPAKADSSFFLTDDVGITYLQPSNLADYPLDKVEAQGLLFEWTNSLPIPQKIQVSNSPEFQNVLFEETVQGTQKNFTFQTEGKYFWRVGHILDKAIYWSNVATFTLSKKIPVSPLEIHDFPKLMDFRLTPHYEIGVHDLNKCEQYEFAILRGDTVITKVNTTAPKFKIGKLEDGNYRVKVIGKVKDNTFTGPAVREFTVRNSQPLQAPRIKKKKVKLLVYLKTALDFIFSSAHAAEPPRPYYNLEWEETPGATYEIEISKSTPENVIIREQVDVPKYKFIVTGPETFYWRVRSRKNNEWSPFSEFAVMEVEDRLKRISDALMISPVDGTTLDSSDEKPTIEFTWKEPDARASYFLEISTQPDGSKPRVISVKGGSYRVAFKKLPKQIFWRVFAESKYKTRTSNSEYYRITTAEPDPDSKENLPGKFILRGAGYMIQSKNVMDFSSADLEKRDETLTGPVFEFNAEYLPGRWKHKRSINAYLRYLSLSSAETNLSEQKLGLEYGWLTSPEKAIKHNFYAGLHFYDNMSFKFGSDINGNYNLMFISGRYLYRRPLTEKVNFEFTAGLQLPKIGFNPLIVLRPGINYKLKEDLWLDGFLILERLSHELKDTANNNNVKIQYQNVGLGAGLTYFIGK